MDDPKTLATKVFKRLLHIAALIANNMTAEVAVVSLLVALPASPLRNIEHDRHRQHVVFSRERHQRTPRAWLHIGRVDHRHQPALKTLLGDKIQDREGVLRRLLTSLIV